MGCQDFAQCYLNLLNAILLVFSIVILGYAAYLANELEDFTEAYDEGAIITPIVFAGFMFGVSILGLVAVYCYSKILLIVYLVFATIITFAVLVSGSIVLTFSGVLDDVENEQVVEGAGTFEANTIDFALGIYVACCEEFNETFTAPELCDANDADVACISDLENFEEFRDNTPEAVCEFLEDVEIDDTPIVGDPDVNDGCGNGDPQTFVGSLTQFISDNLRPLGVISVVLSVLMFLDLCTTCVLLWTSKDKFSGEKKEIEENEKSAADVAEGEEVKY